MQSVSARSEQDSAQTDEWVYALEDYTPQEWEDGHMLFHEEDVIRIISKVDENWWVGEIVGSPAKTQGKFPSKCVEVFSIFMKGSEKDKKDKEAVQKKTLKDKVKSKVSKKKRRFMKEGYNLDLTYITPNIIAMGYPSDNLAGMYRNHIRDVQKFLSTRHKDGYKLYNLCAEREYKAEIFEGRVARYPFDDHNPCPFNMIEPFCKDVFDHVHARPENCAAIHCKAGKGRTGLLITCFLIYDKYFQTSAMALRFYAIKRTMDAKGITIPSQIRYVHYFEKQLVLRSQKKDIPDSNPLILTSLWLRSVMGGAQLDPTKLWFAVTTEQGKFSSKGTLKCNGRLAEDYMFWASTGSSGIATLDGDVRIQIYQDSMFDKEKLCQLWINTRFIDTVNTTSPETEDFSGAKNIQISFGKMQLDKACKDIEHKLFTDNFTLELQLRVPAQRSMAPLEGSPGKQTRGRTASTATGSP
eukprot:gb/GEZN01006247.1/.p1 GENE.gb/GEZN01006247.1/~~gb/GEZN01006247.1/.p1  ORF type:complete len:468 (-),score=44.80 gb/GEZN01006247.1/:114-1517(-)